MRPEAFYFWAGRGWQQEGGTAPSGPTDLCSQSSCPSPWVWLPLLPQGLRLPWPSTRTRCHRGDDIGAVSGQLWWGSHSLEDAGQKRPCGTRRRIGTVAAAVGGGTRGRGQQSRGCGVGTPQGHTAQGAGKSTPRPAFLPDGCHRRRPRAICQQFSGAGGGVGAQP